MEPMEPFEKVIEGSGAVTVLLWCSRAIPAEKVASLFELQAVALEELAGGLRQTRKDHQSLFAAASLIEKSTNPSVITAAVREVLAARLSQVEAEALEMLLWRVFSVTRSATMEPNEVMGRLVEMDRAAVAFIDLVKLSVTGGAA